MAGFTHHIFVCSNQRQPGHPRGCCDAAGKDALRAALKAEIRRRGLDPLVRVNRAGCLDQCELGPTVVIYPQAIWYGGVNLEDVPRIVEETVVQGNILEDLVIPDDQLTTKKLRSSPKPVDKPDSTDTDARKQIDLDSTCES